MKRMKNLLAIVIIGSVLFVSCNDEDDKAMTKPQ